MGILDAPALTPQSGVPRWRPNTVYTAGALVMNATGQIVSAKAAFTSSATYNAANWTLVPPSIYAGKYLSVYGNSYAAGTGATPTTTARLSALAATELGMVESNGAVGGEQTFETLKHAYSDQGTPNRTWIPTINTGIIVYCSVLNDARLRGTAADGYALTGASLNALLELWRCGTKVEQSTFTESGTGWATWSTPSVFNPSGGSGQARYTGVNGSAYTFTAIGDTVVIFGVGYDTAYSLGVEYRVDGVLVKTKEYGSLANARTPALVPIYAERLTGMGDGQHTVEVRKVSGTGNLFADCVAYPAEAPPRVIIVPALKLPSAGYTNPAYDPFINGSDTVLANYNQLVAGIARRFDNTSIAKVSNWDSATMVAPDNIHPNNAGHRAIADAIIASARAPVH